MYYVHILIHDYIRFKKPIRFQVNWNLSSYSFLFSFFAENQIKSFEVRLNYGTVRHYEMCFGNWTRGGCIALMFFFGIALHMEYGICFEIRILIITFFYFITREYQFTRECYVKLLLRLMEAQLSKGKTPSRSPRRVIEWVNGKWSELLSH